MLVSFFCRRLLLLVGVGLHLLMWSGCNPEGGGGGNGQSPQSITSDATWKRGTQVEVLGRLVVDGATLTIEPGVRVRMGAGAQIVVGHAFAATLRIEGSDAEPVIFEAQDASAPWLGIQFLDARSDSRIRECEIRHAGSSDVAALRIAKLNFPIEDLDIHEAVGVGMQIESVDLAAGALLEDVEVHSRGGHGIVGDGAWLGAIRGSLEMKVPTGQGVLARGGVVRAKQLKLPSLKVPYVIDGPVQVDVADLDLGDDNRFHFTSRGEFDLGCNEPTKVEAKDCLFTSVESTKSRGQWKGITCNSYVQSGSLFDGCRFEAAGAGEPAGALVLYDCKGVIVRNCRFEKNRGYGVVLVSPADLSPSSQGNVYVDNELGDIGRLRGRGLPR